MVGMIAVVYEAAFARVEREKVQSSWTTIGHQHMDTKLDCDNDKRVSCTGREKKPNSRRNRITFSQWWLRGVRQLSM